MPGLEEVLYYLTGIWLLIRRKAEGFRYLDFTDQGVMRSFWAIVWALPFLFLTWVFGRQLFLQELPATSDPGAILYFRFFMIDMASWITPLLIMLGFVILTRLEKSFSAVIVTNNWVTLLFAIMAAIISALELVLPALHDLWGILWLLQLIACFVFIYSIMLMVYQGNKLNAAATTAILIVPGILMAQSLQSFLGIVVN